MFILDDYKSFGVTSFEDPDNRENQTPVIFDIIFEVEVVLFSIKIEPPDRHDAFFVDSQRFRMGILH